MESLQSKHNSSEIKRLNKLHKPNNPIRPIVNWQNRPCKVLFQHPTIQCPSPLPFHCPDITQLLYDCQEIAFENSIKINIVRYYQYMCKQSQIECNELYTMLSSTVVLTLTLLMKFNPLNNFSQKLRLLLR